MSQNSGPFLASPHGYSTFNPRFPSSSSSLKRTSNGPTSLGHSPNTSAGSAMNVPPTIPTMRPHSPMGPMKPGTMPMNPMEKSNSMPYSSRYTRKPWSVARSFHDKNIRAHDEHDSSFLRPGLPNSTAPSDSMNNSSFTIEPAADDDESDDLFFSSRHIAAARFQRNQRLLYEIFNEVCIPDLRSNVNVDRILTLRRQVSALETHRETFEKDLNELEEKHAEKKRKFSEANEKFHYEYIEASSTNLSEEKMNEILQKHEAMEKLQKEKQVFLQEQQQLQQEHPQTVSTVPPTQPSSLATTVSQSATSVSTRIEPISANDVPQQQTPRSISTPPPPSSSAQTQLPSLQATPTPLPPSQSMSSPLPSSQLGSNQLPHPQSMPTHIAATQSIQSQIPSSHPTQSHASTSVMQQTPQLMSTPQGYPTVQAGNSYAPAPSYSHPQQTQYRPPLNQRPGQYPPNVQWQQQQQPPQQQQWQANTYDPRYYNPYPPNGQWPQQQSQQQWSSNQSQQQTPQMRGPPQQQQQSQVYANGVHYGYGGTSATWNPAAHPSQQYGYPPNSPYDPTPGSASSQQYYSPSQMHNHSQGYDYGLPPQQQHQHQPPPMN